MNNLLGFNVVENTPVSKDSIYCIPKIDGLTIHDGKLQIAKEVPVRGKANEHKIVYRDLNEDEKKRFAIVRKVKR